MKTSRHGRSASFLTDTEYTFITERIHRDRADVTVEPFSLRKYLAAGLDVRIWGFGLIYYCTTTTAYALAYFLSLIYREGMGFSTGASLCLFAPPYVAAGVVMFASSWVGDRYRVRGAIIVFNTVLTLIGLPLMVRLPTRFIFPCVTGASVRGWLALHSTLLTRVVFLFRVLQKATPLGSSAVSSRPWAQTPTSPQQWLTR
jgi:hypothetical protein